MNNTLNALVDQLMSPLQGSPLQQMAQQLGTDTEQARTAVGAALPMLRGALRSNAAQPQGTMDLWGALQRNHSGPGAGLGDLGGLLGSLLDQDGDGQVGLGDLFKIGGSLLGGRR